VKGIPDRWSLVGLLVLLILSGCSGDADTGPGEVRWDRVSCVRCLMSVSDRNFSAQVRGGPADRKSRLHFFDDLGCAVIWLQDKPWGEDPRTEIWVTDAVTGQWLDARTALYETGFLTPMDYGLGARPQDEPQDEPGGDRLTYEQAVRMILVHDEETRGKNGR
jgi:copper chaperone NosL